MAVWKSSLLKFVAEYLNIITRSDRPGQKQGVGDKHGPDQQSVNVGRRCEPNVYINRGPKPKASINQMR